MASHNVPFKHSQPGHSSITIRRMTRGDVGFGMRLKRAAGWNQTANDWFRFLSLQPNGCFVAESNGFSVATVTYCLFGPVAWIGLLLVDPAYRRRGIATCLMRQMLSELDAVGLPTIRLDATSVGRPLYERLGFRPQYRVHRLSGIPNVRCGRRSIKTQAFHWTDWNELWHLDRQIVQIDRAKLLKRLFAENSKRVRIVRRGGRLRGFAVDRAGGIARQIGPLVASDAATGEQLFADVCQNCKRQNVFVDIPESNQTAQLAAEAAGLSKVREFVRMVRGRPCQEDTNRLWASSGPEKG